MKKIYIIIAIITSLIFGENNNTTVHLGGQYTYNSMLQIGTLPDNSKIELRKTYQAAHINADITKGPAGLSLELGMIFGKYNNDGSMIKITEKTRWASITAYPYLLISDNHKGKYQTAFGIGGTVWFNIYNKTTAKALDTEGTELKAVNNDLYKPLYFITALTKMKININPKIAFAVRVAYAYLLNPSVQDPMLKNLRAHTFLLSPCLEFKINTGKS